MLQSMREMSAQYQVEFDDYKLRFFTKWGYTVLAETDPNFRFLNNKKQRMCIAFWNHIDVKRCLSLVELYSMVLAGCKLQRSEK